MANAAHRIINEGSSALIQIMSEVSERGKEMSRASIRGISKSLACLLAAAIVAMPLAALAQTKIVYHSNKSKLADDVKVGRQAAAEAAQQFPLLRASEATAYVEKVGQRLVASITG